MRLHVRPEDNLQQTCTYLAAIVSSAGSVVVSVVSFRAPQAGGSGRQNPLLNSI